MRSPSRIKIGLVGTNVSKRRSARLPGCPDCRHDRLPVNFVTYPRSDNLRCRNLSRKRESFSTGLDPRSGFPDRAGLKIVGGFCCVKSTYPEVERGGSVTEQRSPRKGHLKGK